MLCDLSIYLYVKLQKKKKLYTVDVIHNYLFFHNTNCIALGGRCVSDMHICMFCATDNELHLDIFKLTV